MRLIFGVIGAMIAGGIASALGIYGGFGAGAFRAIAAAVGMGCGWLLYGMIEERQERARIARELEQDRIRYEQERKKTQ
jgi:hypothetical protein